MPVVVRHPKIEVLLHKTIDRKMVDGKAAVSARYEGKRRTLDLTTFIGEGGGVRVTKGIHEPAGAFSITLPDKMFADSGQMDSVYSLIEPMDVVEIRFSHEPQKTLRLPIVMRGFVSDVRRSETMGQDGRPSRQIVITGHDYGKILQIVQIIYFSGYVLGQNLLTSMKMFANYGVKYGADGADQPFGTLLTEVLEKVINYGATDEDGRWSPAFIASMASANGHEGDEWVSQIEFIQPDVRDPGGPCNVYGVNQFQGGTIYDLLTRFGDVGPFYELFTEDREDGVFLVYRPNPYKDADGKWIVTPDEKTKAAVIEIDDSVVSAVSVSRSDANVANYFWVDMSALLVVDQRYLKQAAAIGQDGLVEYEYQNNTPWLYGFRKMEVVSSQGVRVDGQKGEELNKATLDIISMLTARRKTLVAYNKDNVVFERGTLRVAGNVNIRPGGYVRVRRGDFVWECYAVTVDHDFQPFHSFTTTIQFERGTGFIERIKKSGSPYLSEIRAGGI